MRDAITQVFDNLRAHKLRSVLTMFGILWGVVSVVILSATGEGFQQGNQAVLEQLGRNVAIVWGGRTTMQAGGERAGTLVRLTYSDVEAVRREAALVAVVSAEINRTLRIKSRFNDASLQVHGVEPAYQGIRTIDVDEGRLLSEADEREGRRVALVGAEAWEQLFGNRPSLGERLLIRGVPYTIVGRIRRKDQDSSYSGQDNSKLFVPFTAMARDFPRPDVPPGTLSQILVAPHQTVVDALPGVLAARTGAIRDIDWPLERNVREVLARHRGFDPRDRDAIRVWDTSIESLIFGRIISAMKRFFTIVGVITLLLGGVGVMNIMLVAVRERTREIGVRKALGATTSAIQRQFFLEGLLLTLFSGALGFMLAAGIMLAVNQLPMPARFAGMVLTWPSVLLAIGTLISVGVITATYPARRAALLPPVEALRYESS
jgi:putative ABC transport system permease protein